MSEPMDQLARQFEKFQAQFKATQERFTAMQQIQGELADVEASATSADKAVRVVAGPGGAVKDIQISAEAMEKGDASSLSTAITSTIQQAVAAAAQKQTALVDEAAGDSIGFSVSNRVFESQAEAFDTTVEELKEKAAGGSSAEDDDEDAQNETTEPPREAAPQPSNPAPARPKPQEDFAEDDEDDEFGSVFES